MQRIIFSCTINFFCHYPYCGCKIPLYKKNNSTSSIDTRLRFSSRYIPVSSWWWWWWWWWWWPQTLKVRKPFSWRPTAHPPPTRWDWREWQGGRRSFWHYAMGVELGRMWLGFLLLGRDRCGRAGVPHPMMQCYSPWNKWTDRLKIVPSLTYEGGKQLNIYNQTDGQMDGQTDTLARHALSCNNM